MLRKTKITTLVFVLVGIAMVSYLSTVNYKARVILGGKTFEVDVSDNDFTLQKGLSGRESLKNNEGMFFIFGNSGKHGFWMKEMKFAIDIIWINENFEIVHIEENVKPETYPTVFYPSVEDSYVLEIQAGQVSLLGVKLGDRVEYFR